jgi:H+/Cl- antiporter ClcA
MSEIKRTFQNIVGYFKLPSRTAFYVGLRPYLQGVPYWLAAALVGIWAVVYSGAFARCIEMVTALYAQNPYYLFLTSPLCFFLSVWIVEKYAPTASGTGIPQVTQALAIDSPAEIESYLSLKVALVVAASSLLSVLGAGSLGREGPMVHMSACVFYWVGLRSRKFLPYEDHRCWIVAGGAAGVAAAFNAPLAGVVFVLEELSHQHFHRFKGAIITAAIIGGLTAQAISGRYLYFGFPKLSTVPTSAVFWAIVIGTVCGLSSFPFNKMLAIDWAKILKVGTRKKLAVLAGLTLAAIANFINPASLGGGMSMIQNLLFEDKAASWSAIVARFLGTTISHLSGCAGGFLAPLLALGAAIGSKFAQLAHYPNPHLMVMMGMSAFLSAIMGAPFTAFVIVMEMTDRHSAIFPLMVAALVGHLSAKSFKPEASTP